MIHNNALYYGISLYKSAFIFQRLSTEMTATIIQLYLWAPSSWLQNDNKMPPSNEVS